MKSVDAGSLLRVSIRSPDGVIRARAVLPFFTTGLDVRFLLVVLKDGTCVVTTDLPQRVTFRGLDYAFAPRLDRPLVKANAREFEGLLHFDPWWLLKDRDDIPAGVREAVVATNLPGRANGDQIKKLAYDETLTSVVAGRVGKRQLSRLALLEFVLSLPH